MNALLGENKAKTGIGRPVTGSEIYDYEATIDGKQIVIYDSWGLEAGKDKEWERMVNDKLKEKGIEKDMKEWFHTITYCIGAGGSRIQDIDKKIIKKFTDEKYNVIVAITKADQLDEDEMINFITIIKEELEEYKVKNEFNIIPIAAKPKKKVGMDKAPDPFGLQEYKVALFISFDNMFIDRMPKHIVGILKKDVDNAVIQCPRDGNDISILRNKIKEYFTNIVKNNTEKYLKENIQKYYSSKYSILNMSKNVDISNLNFSAYLHGNYSGFIEDIYSGVFSFDSIEDSIASIISAMVLHPLIIPTITLAGFADFFGFLYYKIFGQKKEIDNYIEEVSYDVIEYISSEIFEEKIRKAIIDCIKYTNKNYPIKKE